MRRAAIALLLPGSILFEPGASCAGDIGALTRAGSWPAAEAQAATAPDPIAATLVRYLRLLARNAASAAEIDAFMTAHPDWPQRALLDRRYAEALASERDEATARTLCQRRPPPTAAALLRCADVASTGGVASPGGEDAARRAWAVGITDPASEAKFMLRWGGEIGAERQLERFERLAWTEKATPGGTLARQALRLDPAARSRAEARLALRRDDPTGPALFAALPLAAQGDPGLVLDLARWYRHAGRDADAAKAWTERGVVAEAAAAPERQRLFWNERNALVRDLLRAGDDALAYQLAALPAAATTAQADATFLAGWIALRRLARPELAALHFVALAGSTKSAITQSRAHYWLGRALAAAGKADEAEAAFKQAASWPTTYYGQLATLALPRGAVVLRERLHGAADPAWDEARALDLAGAEFGRAAIWLAAWGEARQAKPFLQSLEDRESDPGGKAVVASFALGLGLPESAVAAARRAGRDGVMLPRVGWPEAADPPSGPVERAVALGLIRQESSFDAAAGSPSGAQGLMQLMPATAAEVARKLGAATAPLTDPAFNMRLGTAYLAGLLNRFDALPPALAGYNAGPTRARQWIAGYGDPATGAIDPVDWVELIPYTETRDYVQRVVENIVIYRARDGVDAPHPVLRWAADGS